MSDTLDIKLLDKSYRIACAAGERDSLLAAVAVLEAKLGEFGKVAKGGGERAAVMAALDLAHELVIRRAELPTQTTGSDEGLASASLKGRIDSIEARIAAALERP